LLREKVPIQYRIEKEKGPPRSVKRVATAGAEGAVFQKIGPSARGEKKTTYAAHEKGEKKRAVKATTSPNGARVKGKKGKPP